MWATRLLALLVVVGTSRLAAVWAGEPKEAGASASYVRIDDHGRGFVLHQSGKPFIPLGFNYDHDSRGRLLEDYWEAEWATVEEDFQEMKRLGANTVRIHLQLGRLMETAQKPNRQSLRQLQRLLQLCRRLGLYLDITGLGCYHKQDVPAWYDRLAEAERWEVQARFWQAVAATCRSSPAVFCYDLMNEPVVPGGNRARSDWLGPAFAGKHFVQFIALDRAGRERTAIARAWIERMVRAVRSVDRQHLITVGLVPWSLDRPGLSSGFVPGKTTSRLDFLSVHLYPTSGKLDEALQTLAGFSVGKPLVIEETFPLRCSPEELEVFLHRSQRYACGWIGFYWGKTPEEYQPARTIADKIMLQWLELFQRFAARVGTGQSLPGHSQSVPP